MYDSLFSFAGKSLRTGYLLHAHFNQIQKCGVLEIWRYTSLSVSEQHVATHGVTFRASLGAYVACIKEPAGLNELQMATDPNQRRGNDKYLNWSLSNFDSLGDMSNGGRFLRFKSSAKYMPGQHYAFEREGEVAWIERSDGQFRDKLWKVLVDIGVPDDTLELNRIGWSVLRLFDI